MRRLTPLLLFWTALAHAQVITTVAGTNSIVPASGVPALTAALGRADAVAVDSAGNIYAADSLDQVIVKVTPTGTLTVVAGNGRAGFSGDGGPAINASLHLRGDYLPTGLAVDSTGALYISDFNNNRVRKVSGGIITTVAGSGAFDFQGDGGPATAAALNGPEALAVDSAGNLYIADTYNHAIRRVSGGIITTIAGGSPGFSGDGGPASRATLLNPFGVAVDSAGNLFIADTGNNRIRRVSGGTITTIAGNGNDSFSGDGGPATSAALDIPVAVAVDSAGNLYIDDYNNNRVRKVSNGVISSVTGGNYGGALGDGGPALQASFNSITGIALDSLGNLYIADFLRGRIRKVTGATISTVAGNGAFSGDGGPAANATLNSPFGIAVAAGNLYIADRYNNRIRRVAIASGTITTVAGNGLSGSSGDNGPAISASLDTPAGVAVDSSGNLFIADDFNNAIRRVSLSGTITRVAGNGDSEFNGDGIPAINAAFSTLGVAVDTAGNIYIADTTNNRIRKVSGSTITTIAGNGRAGFSGDNGNATAASLNQPEAVAVDSAGNVYIADTGNNRVRKITGTTITTLAGNGAGTHSGDGGPAAAAALNAPEGIAVDAAGSVYIADTANHRVRKVSGGIIVTVAGDGNVAFSGDGGPATAASLNGPDGVAVDSAGNLFIADAGNNRIREVLAARPSYQASPQSLTFSAPAGGNATGAQVIRLSSALAGLAYTSSVNAAWLSVTPSSGAVPSALQVVADPAALTPGNYQGTITITVPLATPVTTMISVTFTVQGGAPASPSVTTGSISFASTQGGAPLTQSLIVGNAGAGSLTFTAAIAGAPWLAVSPAEATATPSSPASLTLTATPGALAPGTYNGVITVTGAGKSIPIPVTLSISSPTAILLLSQSALNFRAVAQGGSPLPQNFGILNTGEGSMSWTASASTLSGGNWLQISALSGTVARPSLDVSMVNVTVDSRTLSAGTYYGRIQVSSPAVNSPQVMTVILTVLPAGFNLGTQVFPAGLVFTGAAGTNPGSQDVQVGNPASTPISFLSASIGAGFSYLPTNATVAPNQPATIHVYPDFSRMPPGTVQKGTIVLQFSDDSPPQTISVLMVVAPAGGSAPSDSSFQAGACSPLQVVYRSPQPAQGTILADLGKPLTMDVRVTDACGNLVGANRNALVTARFNDGAQVPMTHVGNGTWQGTWRPVTTGQVALNVVAFAGQNADVIGGQSSVISALVSTPAPAGSTPAVTAEGVVHAASLRGGIPISPGGLISVFGQNLSDSAGQTNLPLPKQANGTQVLLGDRPLPILYTSELQLNVQVPFTVPLNSQSQITVQRGNTLSVPQPLVVAAAQPGIFSADVSGSGQGIITKSDGVTIARPATPAAIGETVVIYCTGLGPVTPKVEEGQRAPSTPPLATTDNVPTVTIGGRPAGVSFSGLTPGFAGLYQINAVVPSGIATGDAVPVVISIAGQTSPPVTIAVR